MILRHSSTAMHLVITAAVLLSDAAGAETHNAEPAKGTAMTNIHVIVGEETLSAMLDETPAGRAFAALLPLELSLSDYHATEKVADLPRKLDISGAPSSYTPEAGDITYYAPWGNLAIFYKPFRSSRGLVRLGALSA